MEIIIPRQVFGISDELVAEDPNLAIALEDGIGEGMLPGVWRDGNYYLWGSSHFNEKPEEVVWVMTSVEYKRWRRGTLDTSTPAMIKMVFRAKRLYPDLSML